LATCFDPTGSSSGLHCEPTMFTWDPKQCLQECTQLSKHLLVYNEGLMMTLQGHHQAFIVN